MVFIIVVFYEVLNILWEQSERGARLAEARTLLSKKRAERRRPAIRFPFFLCLALIFLRFPFFLHAENRAEENFGRVERALREEGIPFETRSLLSDYGGFHSSILVRKDAAILRRDAAESGEPGGIPGTFALALPLEASFSVDTGLALARYIQEKESGANIIVAFLGDEENSLPPDAGGVSNKGLRDLLSLVESPENWTLCYLDAPGAPREIVIRHGIGGYVAPLEIIRPLSKLFERERVSYSFLIRFNEIYKLKFAEGHEALSLAWNEEVNGFALSGSDGSIPAWYAAVSPEKLSALLFDYAGSLSFPIPGTDRHYSVFPFSRGRALYLSEGITAALLVITAGILLFLFLVFSVKHDTLLLFHIRLFFRYIWLFFIFLLLMVFSLKASGIIYSRLLAALGPGPETPAGQPNFLGAGLTVLLASLFFFLPSPLLGLIRFPRRARFYGYSSVIFITLGMFFAACLDFSYVPVFLWAFVFVVLGASFSNAVLVFLSALLVPLLFASVITNLVETGSGRIAELFILSVWNTPAAWIAAVQLTLLSLPVILLLKRGTILIQKSRRAGLEIKPNRKYRLIVIPVLIAAVLGGMALQIRLIPKNENPPERRFLEDSGAIVNIELRDLVFKDSRVIRVRISGRGNPLRFDVSIASAGNENLLPLYSSPVPFESADGGKKIVFSLGEKPPNPLELEIVAPLQFEGILAAGALYDTWQSGIDPGEELLSKDYVFKAERKIELTR